LFVEGIVMADHPEVDPPDWIFRVPTINKEVINITRIRPVIFIIIVSKN
jgi:hypothetical protein